MGRLVKEALYRKSDFDDYYAHALKRGQRVCCDWRNPNADWEHLPETIRRIDPHGERSYALLQEVERLK